MKKFLVLTLVLIFMITMNAGILAQPKGKPPKDVPGDPGFEFPGQGESGPPFTPPPFNDNENEDENNGDNNNGNDENGNDENGNNGNNGNNNENNENINDDNENNNNNKNNKSNNNNRIINHNNINNSIEHDFDWYQIRRVNSYPNIPNMTKATGFYLFIVFTAILDNILSQN